MPEGKYMTYLGEWRITCYCSCEQCCGKYALNRPIDDQGNQIVVGAYGRRLTPGISCATNTGIPCGTELYIDGYGTVVVEDTTAD